MSNQSQPQRILIVQTAFLGDVVLTLPLVRSMRAQFPSASIHFLAIPAGISILQSHRDIDRVWIYDKRNLDKGIAPFVSLIKRLRAEKFDLAIVPHRSLRSAALTFAAAIPRRVGFDRSAGRFLLTDIVPYPENIHETIRNRYLLAPFNIDPTPPIFPALTVPEDDKETVKHICSVSGLELGSRNLLAIAPGSVWATKRWPVEHFAAIIDRLNEHDVACVLIGGDSDWDVVSKIDQLTQVPFCSVIGKLTPLQSAYLISQCAAILTNDSAPLHLGDAVNTPVVAIFGPTVPAFGFYPNRDHDVLIEPEPLDCRPCGVHGHQSCPIGTHLCMTSISPDLVISKLLDILNKK